MSKMSKKMITNHKPKIKKNLKSKKKKNKMLKNSMKFTKEMRNISKLHWTNENNLWNFKILKYEAFSLRKRGDA